MANSGDSSAHPPGDGSGKKFEPQQHHIEGRESSESLSSRANLGGASLADANASHLNRDTASGHLPQMKVSLENSSDVRQAHQSLMQAAHGHIGSAADEARFGADMTAFEKRAAHDKVTSEQITKTYDQVQKILKDAPDSPLSAQQRQELAGQWMQHLADPDTNRSGWHDTCAWTLLENRLLTKDPEKITAKFAQALTTGSVTTLDMAAVRDMVAKGDTAGGVPLKVLNLDKKSLQPDQEAQGASQHSDRRDYADQIAQVVEASMSWELSTVDPKGESVSPGTMQYRQAPLVERPSDVSADGKRYDKSGESVSYIDPKTGEKKVEDGDGHGFGGATNQNQVALVNSIISGRAERTFMANTLVGALDPQTTIVSSSQSELHSQLQQLKKHGQFPMPVDVQIDKKGIVEDYLATHPDRTRDNVPKNAWHAISVTGVDSKGNVQIFNPWGIHKTISEADLYKAMSK